MKRTHTARKRRSRRRKGEGTETRTEILEIAKRLFVDEGYERTTIRRIATALGLSSTALYLYFPDKNAILREICAETFIGLTQESQRIRQLPLSAAERLQAGLRTYIDFGLAHQHEYILTFLTRSEYIALPDDVMGPGDRAFQSHREIVADAVAAGITRNQDVESLAQLIWASCHGLVSLFLVNPDFPWVERERLIKDHIDAVLHGVLAGHATRA
jgi:AcrR family transcriptional regulator